MTTLECMCVVCHGPIERKTRRGVTAIVCNPNCHTYWHHQLKRGGALGQRYAAMRVMHAYRRSLEVALAWVTKRLTNDGWLEVGA